LKFDGCSDNAFCLGRELDKYISGFLVKECEGKILGEWLCFISSHLVTGILGIEPNGDGDFCQEGCGSGIFDVDNG